MQKPTGYDFCGWATKRDIRCADGLVIKQGAFDASDGKKVSLVWQHNYTSPSNVLGHMILHSMDEGVYAYGYFNNTETAKDARELLKNGDINAMSMGAKNIQRQGNDVVHGEIYEVSLVMSGANPGARIEEIMMHSNYGGDEPGDTAIIYNGEFLTHSDELEDEGDDMSQDNQNGSENTGSDETIGDVLATLTPKQQAAVDAYVAAALDISEGEEGVQHSSVTDNDDDDESENGAGTSEDPEDKGAEKAPESKKAAKPTDDEEDDEDEDDEKAPKSKESAIKHSAILEGEDTLKQNAFNAASTNNAEGTTINHADVNNAISEAIVNGASSLGNVLHSADLPTNEVNTNGVLRHSINNVDVLFPATTLNRGVQMFDPKALNVEKIMGMFAASPMSRVKNIYMNLTEEDARARGYIKGKEKLDSIEEVFFRETTPQTVIRRTKFERDDMIDMQENGIDTVAFTSMVQQSKLRQEIVRAAFFGDGRKATVVVNGETVKNPDRINPGNIRPITTDHNLFTIKRTAKNWKDFVNVLIMTMPFYQGSGNPSLFMNPLDIAKLRSLVDENGRWLFGAYDGVIPSVDSMAAKLGVKEIVEYREVPVGQAIVVNLGDYTFGASKGGQIANMEFFDIDFNQQKFLIETRLSGALQVPKSAIFVTVTEAGTADLSDLSFDKTGLSDVASWTTDTAVDESKSKG